MNKKGTESKKADQVTHPTRRSLLKGGAVLVGAATLLAGSRPSMASSKTLVFEVAIKGNTWRTNPSRSIPDMNPPRAGDTFVVEGNIYPKGTIPPGPGFVITDKDRIGRYVGRGTFIVDIPTTTPPNTANLQLFLIDEVGVLASEGLEGNVPEILRIITGGSGEYKGAKGEVLQTNIGTNNTILTFTGGPAPNFTFSFDLED